MWGRCVCWCALLFTWPALSAGVRLYPCGDAGYQDVEENTPLTFYCDQYTGSVEWKYKPVSDSGDTSISVCSSTCTASGVPLWYTARATSSTSSNMTTSRTARIPAQSGGRYACDTEQCGLHVFEVQPSSVYTSLQTSDIGIPSVYSQVTAFQNVGARLPQEGQPSSVYTSLQTSDIGVPSVYSQVTAYQNVGARLPQDPAYENCEAGRRAVDENSGARKTGAYVNLPCQR